MGAGGLSPLAPLTLTTGYQFSSGTVVQSPKAFARFSVTHPSLDQPPSAGQSDYYVIG